jgi:hypothetical protein
MNQDGTNRTGSGVGDLLGFAVRELRTIAPVRAPRREGKAVEVTVRSLKPLRMGN